jgi:hypothetical protein
VRATNHAQDSPFGAPRSPAISKSFAMLDAGQNMIAMHGIANRITSNKQITFQIFSRRIRHNEAVTVAMRDQATCQLICFGPDRARFRTRWLPLLRAMPLL